MRDLVLCDNWLLRAVVPSLVRGQAVILLRAGPLDVRFSLSAESLKCAVDPDLSTPAVLGER